MLQRQKTANTQA